MDYKVLGLMSGTSLDGLDLAYCRFQRTAGGWQYELSHCEQLDYSMEMQKKLQDAIELPAPELLQLDHEYGTWLGRKAKDFIKAHNLQVDFIASHGHTVHHLPEKGVTFQMGSGQHLAEASGERVICDFRSSDLVLGGQGAPLVPIGDLHLFSDYDFCLNLGGIANISFQREGKRIAYDIGLANMPLNYLSRKMGLPYDKGGEMARSGNCVEGVLDALNKLEYYRLPFPKSTGYEWFAQDVVPLLDFEKHGIPDLLNTCVVHICEQIAAQLRTYQEKSKASLLVTGGGAFNTYLMDRLKEKLGSRVKIEIPDPGLIAFKEALVFAFMGVLRIREETNVLSSVTGASRDHSSGQLFYPL
ncbi:anhydro-N-acetylmuramic acid kinase [Robiginitalea sp. IMCC43444]|uniref:anhydro-N-acetylmuramic acid kinase n=1 Tax=Robiginitalea sp. IMCC43444 TaxID=3459121 RepID=UPI004041684A